jgi:hypothetical protein
MKQTLTLYPSQKNFQHADLGPMPWAQFRAYIDGLVDRLPLDERETVRFNRSPPSGRGIQITYEHALTDAEIMEDRRQKAIAWAQSLPRDLAEREEIKALKAIIGL